MNLKIYESQKDGANNFKGLRYILVYPIPEPPWLGHRLLIN